MKRTINEPISEADRPSNPFEKCLHPGEHLHLDPNRKISSLSDEEFERYWKAIEKNERWEIGEEDFIPKWIISGKKRGVIVHVHGVQCCLKC